VLTDLAERFDAVLDAIEATDGWVTSRVAPGKLILGELGDIETGVRQLRRLRPLEVVDVELPTGERLRVPTEAEILRVKANLIVRPNQTRDDPDVAALAERSGWRRAANVLADIDASYADPFEGGDGVRSRARGRGTGDAGRSAAAHGGRATRSMGWRRAAWRRRCRSRARTARLRCSRMRSNALVMNEPPAPSHGVMRPPRPG
jgi:hypothetical protein